MSIPRNIKFEMDGLKVPICGFKLGHFYRSEEGLMKAVFWTED
jgi:hypothetical protein